MKRQGNRGSSPPHHHKTSPTNQSPPTTPYKYTNTRVISQSTSPSTTTVESCYSIESLHSSTTNKSRGSYYGGGRECRHWKVIIFLLILTIACGFVIILSAKDGKRDSPTFYNGSREGGGLELPGVKPTHVQFDYNLGDGEGESNGHPRDRQIMSEYIFLYKLPPPLDNDDIHESVKKSGHHHNRFKTQDENSRHHYYNTGVFRPRGSRLWDPHPQYIFHAFNKRFHLVLNQISKKHSLLVPGFKVTTHVNKGGEGGGLRESWVTREGVQRGFGGDDEFEGCFYNGYVLGDLESSVAVSLCNGMTGHIRTSTGSYFIEPRRYVKNEGQGSGEHEIYQIVSQTHDDEGDRVFIGGNSKGRSTASPVKLHNITTVRATTSEERRNLKITSYDYYSDEDYDSGEEEDEEDEDEKVLRPNSFGTRRSKRSLSTERYVELTVVTDQTMSRYHGDNLKHYVLTLLSIVALVYRDASIGNPVNIVLVNFHVLTDTDFSGGSGGSGNSSVHGTSASEMLRNFCKWQKEHNHPDDRNALHHDTALLLTRETICRNPWVGKCDTLGLAELGTMCDHYASCAIVQDNGLSAAFTIAHELGHVMNMPHDDDYKCSGFVEGGGGSSVARDLSDGDGSVSGGVDGEEEEGKRVGGVQHYVMSRMLDHNTYPWAWSRCSRHFLTEFLDAGHGYCLEDKPDSNLLYNDDENSVDDNGPSFSQNGIQQPGEVFSEHKQCEFVFGPNSQLCSYMPPCRRLWCTNHGGPESEESEGCRTQHMPWADGTRCGASKWCQRGACVLKDLEKLKVINGDWGEWQDYGECSRNCGGGVRKSYRECDNPKPRNGGKYCVGPRVRYESCNTFECPGNSTGGFDFRGSQCGAYDGDNFNIHGLPEDVVWVPKYNGISPKDRCKLFCRVQGSSSYYLLKEKVVDGTTCGVDTFDVCVNGACLPAGCDRRLHSSKTLDICGICGGDGSTCTTSQGSYNSTKYGYNAVFRIPSGASNIDIRQRSYDNTARDDNYLALMDPIANEYVLNGHFVVSMFRKTIHYGGSILEYSGSDQIVERINSSSRPIKRDLEVRVLSVGKLKPPDIVFQYVISSEEVVETGGEMISYAYDWVGKRSSSEQSCSNVCSGVTVPYRSFECVRRSPNGNQVVEGSYCEGKTKPPHHPQACNTHCTISYRLTCPESCVHARNHTVECVRTVHSTNTTQRISEKYCVNGGVERGEGPDCVSECRNRKPRWRYTQWSECSVSGMVGSSCRGGGGNSSVGYQMRNVWCQRFNWRSLVDQGVDNFEVVEDGECEGEKPGGRRGCRVGSGGICGEWRIDQWSPCSTTCGPGRTRALYACVLKTQSQTQILPSDYCVHNPKPVVERPCEKVPCAVYSSSNWSECDCLSGMESRNVTCLVNGVGERETTTCERLSVAKPESFRACVEFNCEDYEYTVSNWSRDCRLFNGKYYRYRGVTCERERGRGKCVGGKPESMRECGEWKVESGWTGCNGSCSVGVEVRGVGCYVGGSKVGDDDCEGVVVGGSRPVSERKCFHNCRGGDVRMLRGQEGYGGGVNNVGGSGGGERTGVDRYWYDVGRGGGRGVSTSEAPKQAVTYKWVAAVFGKCTRMTTPKSSSSSCVPSTTHPRSFKKHRQVKCVGETSTPSHRVTTVPTAYCTPPAPDASENCTDTELTALQPCPIWVSSEWSSCTIPQNTEQNCLENSTIGILHGVKTRDVVCVHDTSNNTVGDGACEVHVPKPESEEKCVVRGGRERVCNVTFQWRVGNWSGCVVEGGGKKKCGVGGRKVRGVECLRKWGKVGVVVGDEYCVGKRKGRRGRGVGGVKPKGVRECSRSCGVKEVRGRGGVKWVAGEWSNCSRPCGGYGLRSRRVTCHRTNPFDWTDPDALPTQIPSANSTNYCVLPKPKEYDYCMVSEICTDNNTNVTYSWSHTNYTRCSCPETNATTASDLTPSVSFQKRKVFCKNNQNGQKSPARHCASIPKPKRKKRCECNVFGSCGEVKGALVSKMIEVRDGEYSLKVGGKRGVKVYCHGMGGDEPKEYVGLNEENNWSEIYDKRLIRPESCPRNGSRLSSCECVLDRNRRVGVTKWRRVRVNVTSLRVDVDDFTFASSTQDLIPYATAGDCYSSSMTCPQGRFSIDLRNTGFAVSPLTSWTTTGHRATMRVVRKNYGLSPKDNVHVSQYVQGKCGGYCGTCGVTTSVGLRIDVV